MDPRTVGVLGGGQLGRMMAEAGHRLGVKLAVLDPGSSSSPAGQIAEVSVEGSFNDEEKVMQLASISDLVTTEIEHVNASALAKLEASGKIVHPSASTIATIQDKYQQKVHLAAVGIPLPEFMEINSVADCKIAGIRYGFPFMLKKRRLAYDGYGNCVVKTADDIEMAYEKLGGKELYAEKWQKFTKELAVMVVRSKDGVVSYPVVETIQENNICHIVIAPAQVPENVLNEAMAVAKKAIASFSGYGIFGVEMFQLLDDSIVLNEIAPRPHNSGHYTMEACDHDQFEMHLRAVLGLPCPTPIMRTKVAMMVNVLGRDSMDETMILLRKAMTIPGAAVHWYGKKESRKGRKMAHLTYTADSMAQLRQRTIDLGLDADDVLGQGSSGPKVGVIMGSDSDLPTMKAACEILDKFGVSYECKIVSAHRTPNRMYAYAQSAAERGVQVIIAGAGGAAHLPGMVAALCSLPVIGVPVKTSTLNGEDSLLSIVQMPKGVPVATVAIGNAANAGLLAVRILGGAGDPELLKKMDEYMLKQEDEVLKKADRLELKGYQTYMAQDLAAAAAASKPTNGHANGHAVGI